MKKLLRTPPLRFGCYKKSNHLSTNFNRLRRRQILLSTIVRNSCCMALFFVIPLHQKHLKSLLKQQKL